MVAAVRRRSLVPGSSCSRRRSETQYVYDLRFDAPSQSGAIRPRTNDSEVDGFELMTESDALASAIRGEWKPSVSRRACHGLADSASATVPLSSSTFSSATAASPQSRTLASSMSVLRCAEVSATCLHRPDTASARLRVICLFSGRL